MTSPLGERWQSELDGLNPSREGFAVGVVDRLLAFARDARASDVHLLPQLSGKELHLSLRVDGVLHRIGTIQEGGVNVVARLKVLAGLLTYRTDIPQEGRIRSGQEQLEMRVSSFPTVHGEKVVVRMFVGSGLYRHLEELGFPDSIYEALTNVLQEPQGLIVVCGPSGSGKTTTLYAALRHIQANSPTPRSIVTLEDPVEAVIPGISQSQVKPDGEFNYQRGLASLMRQDAAVVRAELAKLVARFSAAAAPGPLERLLLRLDGQYPGGDVGCFCIFFLNFSLRAYFYLSHFVANMD